MACTIEFIEYVCDQLQGVGEITNRKMFGEYGIYCNGKIIGLACDNQFFLKPTKKGKELLKDQLIEQAPYSGAKLYFLLDNLEDKEYLQKIVKATYEELPDPKPKNKEKEVPKK